MGRLLRLACLVACLFVARNASGTTYYIAANGNDANNGTSKATPWLHAPGMTGCTATCASTTPQPGDQFILRGGDTWWVSGAGTPVGLPWNWIWDGSPPPSARTYIGVDKTYFTGAIWTRPALNGGNPLSTSAVGSCAFQSGSSNVLLIAGGQDTTYDNVELLGFCWSGSITFGTNAMIKSGGPRGIYQNLYLHGWTHTLPHNDDADSFSGSTQQTGGDHNQYVGNLLDGTDSDEFSFVFLKGDCYDAHNNVIRHVSNGFVCNNMHTFHDNLLEFINNTTNPTGHSNGFEFNAEWNQGTEPNTVYNNVLRHTTAAVKVFTCPNNVLTDYYYNNLIYDISASNVFNLDERTVNGCSTAPNVFIYNNTVQSGSDRPFGTFQNACCHTLSNNHIINDSLSCCTTSGSGGFTETNDVLQTNAQATSQGYTMGNNYAPTAGGSTLGAGLNLTTTCVAAGLALCKDTTLGVLRPPTPRPPTSPPNWGVGAYQYPPPNPLTNLRAVPR